MVFEIRPWVLSDLEALVKHANNWNVAKNLTDKFPHPYTQEDGKAFIEFVSNEDLIHAFAIDIDGQAVGGIGIHPQSDIHRKNAELGYWLAELFWGQGIMSNAVRQLVDFTFMTLDIDRIFARPFGMNVGSHRVLEKSGFTLEGRFYKVLLKNGEYLDELVYAIRRENWAR